MSMLFLGDKACSAETKGAMPDLNGEAIFIFVFLVQLKPEW